MNSKRYFTLFILANDASRARQLKIPVGLFKIACAVSAVFFLVFGFVVYDYAMLKTDKFELHSLKKENTSQKIELQGFASKLKDLESQLSKLGMFDKKLRIIANLEEPKASGIAGADQVKGIGGDASPEENLVSTAPEPGQLTGKMHTRISALENSAKAQENSFTELQEYLMKRSSLLASTPSVWPSRGWVTSNYGERVSPFTGSTQLHKGIDIANRVGTPVVAPGNGIVVESTRDAGLGKVLTISHGYGIKTVYGHLSEVYVRVGQRVKRGDKIASMGNTGHSTGPHLHYSVMANGIAVNPSRYILN